MPTIHSKTGLSTSTMSFRPSLGDMETKRSINPPRGKKGPRYVLNRDKVSAYIANKNGLDPKKNRTNSDSVVRHRD